MRGARVGNESLKVVEEDAIASKGINGRPQPKAQLKDEGLGFGVEGLK